uniref:Uncharacterized protein n=1 Tax=Stomoxys calcitrans TaxID=35570 RepID=A0A1I8NX14_STOCA
MDFLTNISPEVHTALNAKQPTLNPIARPSPLLLSARTLQMDMSKSAASSIISSNLTRESNSSIMRDQRRRQSSVNAVSWNDTISIQHSSNAPRTSTTAEESQCVTMRQQLLHRRHQSLGNAKYTIDDQRSSQKSQNDEPPKRRRSSSLWWAQEEAMRSNARRPYSWGPVGTDIFATDSTSLMYQTAAYMCDLRLLHGQCILWNFF